MRSFHHAIVWIDHTEATVSRFRGYEESDVDVHSHASLQRLHHLRTGWDPGCAAPADADFYQRIASALDAGSDVVIRGPGNAKLEFKAFLDQHRPHISSRIEAVTPGRAAGSLLRAI